MTSIVCISCDAEIEPGNEVEQEEGVWCEACQIQGLIDFLDYYGLRGKNEQGSN